MYGCEVTIPVWCYNGIYVLTYVNHVVAKLKTSERQCVYFGGKMTVNWYLTEYELYVSSTGH